MKQVDIFRQKLNSLDPNKPFSFNDFEVESSLYNHLAVFLNREVQDGNIAWLAKGLYYIPQTGVISGKPIRPSNSYLFKIILKRDKGYPTGISVYNQFGLSTQFTTNLVYATNRAARSFSIWMTQFIRVKAMVPDQQITPENIPFLQMLDCILNIEKIPDRTPDDAVIMIKGYIKKNYSGGDFEKIEQLSHFYPPRVRALLGAILEEMSPKCNPLSKKLKKSLNPSSKYRFKLISEKQLPNLKQFNIK